MFQGHDSNFIEKFAAKLKKVVTVGGGFMIRKVLVVDNNRALRKLIQNKCGKFKDKFITLLAGDGLEAVEHLKNNTVSLVVTDLTMPNMDGFALIAHLTRTYPDIPVIILTADSPDPSKIDALKADAMEYIEKPFVVEELVEKIMIILEKESDGGVLQTFSMEMFVQLIEMEAKTCTIRVENKSSGKIGVLFFNNGELLDARIDEQHGETVAHDIFAWDKVTFYIQDTCKLKEKRIDKGLQSILLDAMRQKDEAADS
jgi:CheY-like chemotaxis protein